MNKILKANIIQKHRNFTIQGDTKELQAARQKFLDWLVVRHTNIRVFEMYQGHEGVIKSIKQVPQYFHEYKYCNTRTQAITEARAETDKLNHEEAIKLICEICLSLMDKKYHFAVFYCKNSRSPHVIIYDLDELQELDRYQRVIARLQFWRSIIPFKVNLLDQAIFDDSHYVPLEFAVHWKHKTPFNLLFEYPLEVKPCKN